MKTDSVEIFQTIRANLQPYTANGFIARVNSETVYELWSEKLFDANGEKIDVVPFASVKIEDEAVKFCIFSENEEGTDFFDSIDPSLMELSIAEKTCFLIKKLDDNLLDQIINTVGLNFNHFKQKGWV